MGMEDNESCVKKTLRSLCLNHGWCYGVFWRFDPRNHMLLTMEDAYYEEHAGSAVDSMLMQVHMLGEGIVGEAALNGKHRWVFVDASTEKQQDSCLDASEFGLQFSSGMKTVAVIPVELRGVVQFGSPKEILETPEFLDQARKFSQDKDNFVAIAPAGSNSQCLNSDASAQSGLFASMISSQNSLRGDGDVSTSWANTFEYMGDCSLFGSLKLPVGSFDEKGSDRFGGGELVIDPSFGSLVKDTEDTKGICGMFEEQYDAACFPASLLDTCQMDDLSQWLADSSKLCVTGLDLEAMLSDDRSSALGGSDIFSGIQGKQPAASSQSSLSNAYTCGEGKPLAVCSNNDELGIDFESRKFEECLEDVIKTVDYDKCNSLSNVSSMSFSGCVSEVEGHYVSAPRKGLFSELGLEHLLKNCTSSSTTKSCIDDQWPTYKRRRIEAYQTMDSQIRLTSNSSEVKLMQPTSYGSQIRDFGSLKDCMPKTKAGLWIDESYSMDAKSCISGVNSQSKRSDEPAKPTKKRARPGESTRPRPKDRQMIADRINELRDLIPNGPKLSIDALLGRTVKHMLFLQSLTKHADSLKQVDEPKLIGQDSNGLVQKGSSASFCSSGSGNRGATWAYEVGGSNLFCPIIVEDLSYPGQMLIEMLCEERGYFLEIADIVRGFGLTILKGVMEARNDKIWAHFVVEGNRHVTRMDVFVSLMQLLHGTTTGETNTTSEPAKVVNNGGPIWGGFQQHVVPLPI